MSAPRNRTACAECRFDLPSLLEGLPEAAAIVAEDYRIVAANEAYRRKFNRGRKVCGRRCYEVSHGLRLPCGEAGECCPIEAASRSRNRSQALHVHHTRHGSEHELVTIYPLARPDESPTAFLEIVRRSPVASARPDGGEELIGSSRPFTRMLSLVSRVAPSDTTVLLQGESGTGKEMVAAAVHRLSHRSDQAFVPVDCSGLTESLFESELFGHEKGSFTGAHQRKRGLAEIADGGTLLLDEVGDIPLPQQVKLLRLLETGTFRRVGSVELRSSNFRLVCATHRDLQQLVREGRFRADLYFRISVFAIPIPPLRERRDDVPLLAEHFLERLGLGGIVGLDSETVTILQAYAFPGNVRELFNIVERACLLRDGDDLLPEHLPEECRFSAHSGTDAFDREGVLPLEAAEERYLRWAAARFPGDRAALAERLGISERTLYRKLQRSRGNGNSANGGDHAAAAGTAR